MLLGGGDGGGEIEFEPIVFDLGFVGEGGGAQIEMQIAENLVAGHVAGDGQHVVGCEGLGFSDFSCEEGVRGSWELLKPDANCGVAISLRPRWTLR